MENNIASKTSHCCCNPAGSNNPVSFQRHFTPDMPGVYQNMDLEALRNKFNIGQGPATESFKALMVTTATETDKSFETTATDQESLRLGVGFSTSQQLLDQLEADLIKSTTQLSQQTYS